MWINHKNKSIAVLTVFLVLNLGLGSVGQPPDQQGNHHGNERWGYPQTTLGTLHNNHNNIMHTITGTSRGCEDIRMVHQFHVKLCRDIHVYIHVHLYICQHIKLHVSASTYMYEKETAFTNLITIKVKIHHYTV